MDGTVDYIHNQIQKTITDAATNITIEKSPDLAEAESVGIDDGASVGQGLKVSAKMTPSTPCKISSSPIKFALGISMATILLLLQKLNKRRVSINK